MSELSLTDTLQLLQIHRDYVKNIINFYADKPNVKYRLPVFPEDISENLVKYIIKKKEGNTFSRKKSGGDLVSPQDGTRIEVKCFTSTGPSSFGPKEKWDSIYFFDAMNILTHNSECILYKIEESNDSEIFQNIKVNKNETFKDQCLQQRRPRIAFSKISQQIPANIQKVFQGNIFEFITEYLQELEQSP